ncbi:biosynthetic peptidoglycan transglycosylase [Candidatus Collinsella stercoripullorum]|uniref:biosynthetic peptidoglycan transglycosylase n=1 Tax=Candidatus Collinsella stercoripullorum TaxID=2838522 RepID=UPI0022E1BE4F|nr:biosynthetic peptidoglycan transglycosylase [Candidatus Collinsella stercoripullorum]
MKTLARIIRRVLVIALVAVIAMCALTVWRGYGMYREALADRPISQTVEELRATDTYTELDELPQTYLDAVVAVEDHRFYEHGGIDPIAICRAAFNDLRTLSLREGGSTITQQVAKNLFFTQDKHFERKVAEVFMAFDLEARYSKREILELYVNSSYFGSGYTGIGQAAPGYLGCDPSDMSDYECALMAGFPNAPELFAADPQAADSRARVVVQQMEKYGFDPGDAAS